MELNLFNNKKTGAMKTHVYLVILIFGVVFVGCKKDPVEIFSSDIEITRTIISPDRYEPDLVNPLPFNIRIGVDVYVRNERVIEAWYEDNYYIAVSYMKLTYEDPDDNCRRRTAEWGHQWGDDIRIYELGSSEFEFTEREACFEEIYPISATDLKWQIRKE